MGKLVAVFVAALACSCAVDAGKTRAIDDAGGYDSGVDAGSPRGPYAPLCWRTHGMNHITGESCVTWSDGTRCCGTWNSSSRWYPPECKVVPACCSYAPGGCVAE